MKAKVKAPAKAQRQEKGSKDMRHTTEDHAAEERPPVFGLTGGIACGKDLAASYFAEHGVAVIDADRVSRALTAPGTPGAAALASLFGKGFVRPDGSPDRRALREHIFSDSAAKQKLEAFLHPLIEAELRLGIERAAKQHPPYILLVSPILLETRQADFCDKIIVMETKRDTRMRRAMQRDGMTQELTEKILDFQMPEAERRRRADFVLDNNGSREQLRDRTGEIHSQLMQPAQPAQPVRATKEV